MPRPNKYQLIKPAPAATIASSAMSPVRKLTTDERSLFNLVIARSKHLVPADMPLLTLYARIGAWLMKANPSDPAFDRCMRTLITTGRALRVHASSVLEPRTAYRKRAKAEEVSPLDAFLAEDDDDGDDDTDG